MVLDSIPTWGNKIFNIFIFSLYTESTTLSSTTQRSNASRIRWKMGNGSVNYIIINLLIKQTHTFIHLLKANKRGHDYFIHLTI